MLKRFCLVTSAITKSICYLFMFHAALDIVVNMFPLTISIPSDLVCTTKETHVVRMELRSNAYELLNIANASNSIMLTLDPDYGLNETNITCVATTSDGLKYEDYITLIVKGKLIVVKSSSCT